MQKSVLTEIVRSLEKKEIRELNKWLQSPAHNQRQDVIKLFDFLVKNLPNGDEAAEKAKAWKAVFPSQPYDDAFMRQVMYFLLKAIEEYLVFGEMVRDEVQYQISLTRIYRKRKLEKAYKQAFRIGSEGLKNQPLRNTYYLLNKYFLEEVEYERLIGVSQNASVNLQEMSDAAEKWFIAEKIRIGCAMFAHHTVYQKAAYNEGLLNNMMEYSKSNELLEEPAIAAYYHVYMANKHFDQEEYFDHLEEIIHHQMSKFDHSEVRTLYQAALNYCVGKVNRGRQDFVRRLFELYRNGLESKYLLENGQVSRYTFLNTVGSALKTSEFDWAEHFINEFQQFLEEKHRQGAVNFSLSRLFFEKGDYNKAQQFLTQFEYDDMLQNIVAKTMLLKIYYERDDFDAFESLLESMRTYLQRKEALDPSRKTAYKNMISAMKKLLHLNIFSKPQREAFREMVQKTNPLMEREWLLEQLQRK